MFADEARRGGRMTDQSLEIDGVSFGYTRAVKALDQVSLVVPSGRFTALLGPNGAGKTTLMALVTRLFSAEAGKITVCGHDLVRQPRAALACMGVVFQRPTLDLDLSVDQNFRYAASLYGMARPAGTDRRGDGAATPDRPGCEQGSHSERRVETPGRDCPGAAPPPAASGARRAHGRPRHGEPSRTGRACARAVS